MRLSSTRPRLWRCLLTFTLVAFLGATLTAPQRQAQAFGLAFVQYGALLLMSAAMGGAAFGFLANQPSFRHEAEQTADKLFRMLDSGEISQDQYVSGIDYLNQNFPSEPLPYNLPTGRYGADPFDPTALPEGFFGTCDTSGEGLLDLDEFEPPRRPDGKALPKLAALGNTGLAALALQSAGSGGAPCSGVAGLGGADALDPDDLNNIVSNGQALPSVAPVFGALDAWLVSALFNMPDVRNLIPALGGGRLPDGTLVSDLVPGASPNMANLPADLIDDLNRALQDDAVRRAIANAATVTDLIAALQPILPADLIFTLLLVISPNVPMSQAGPGGTTVDFSALEAGIVSSDGALIPEATASGFGSTTLTVTGEALEGTTIDLNAVIGGAFTVNGPNANAALAELEANMTELGSVTFTVTCQVNCQGDFTATNSVTAGGDRVGSNVIGSILVVDTQSTAP